MTTERAANRPQTSTGKRASTAALLSVLLASCTSTTGTEPIALGNPSFNQMGPTATLMAEVAAEQYDADTTAADTKAGEEVAAEAGEGAASTETQAALPDAVASRPSGRPEAAGGAPAETAQAQTPEATTAHDGSTGAATAARAETAQPPAKKGFFASIFANNGDGAQRPQPQQAQAVANPPQVASAKAESDADAVQQAAADAGTSDDRPSFPDSAEQATEVKPEARPQVAEAASTANAEPSAQPVVTASVEDPAKPRKGFLASFFGSQPSPPATKAVNSQAGAASKPRGEQIEPASSRAQTKPLINADEDAKPLVQLASAEPAVRRSENLASLGADSNALPGVRQSALFEIKRKSSMDDDSDVDIYEGEYHGQVQLASAAGMARLAPNGLLKQRESVDVACLKPSLVRVLKTVEQRFGKKLVVTSGYRSPSYNKKVRGARRSMHMYCAAADVQVPGVSKWELAKFVRSLPGRGGVGTYCHTESVHVDVGPERDWNWRCRRRRG